MHPTYTSRLYYLPQAQLNRIRTKSKELNAAMNVYEHFIEDEGLPICDFTFFRNKTSLQAKVRRAIKRMGIIARITKHERNRELNKYK